MVKLRHLHNIQGSLDMKNAKGLVENSTKLYDLETLSTVYFSSVEDVDFVLRRTPNLRKLRCIFKVVGNSYQYHVLNFPTRLETLKIHSGAAFPRPLPFYISATNLKCMALSMFYLNAQRLSEIALLQNLQVLKLKLIRFDKEWKVGNGDFPQLKVLKIQDLYFLLEEWTVAEDAFPNLERLVLRECKKLKEIPSCFGDISSLKSIEVQECSDSVDKSARIIQELQVEDYQNTKFKLFLKSS